MKGCTWLNQPSSVSRPDLCQARLVPSRDDFPSWGSLSSDTEIMLHTADPPKVVMIFLGTLMSGNGLAAPQIRASPITPVVEQILLGHAGGGTSLSTF